MVSNAKRPVVLDQIETWITDDGSRTPGILRKRSLSELKYCLKLLLDTPPNLLTLQQAASKTHGLPTLERGSASDRALVRHVHDDSPEVASVSRVSGRHVKTPSKFKVELAEPIQSRPRLQITNRPPQASRAHATSLSSRYASSKRRSSLGSPRARGSSESEQRFVSRVGHAYQANISEQAEASDSGERGDVLVWSASSNPLSEADLDRLVEEQLSKKRATAVAMGLSSVSRTTSTALAASCTVLMRTAMPAAGGDVRLVRSRDCVPCAPCFQVRCQACL